jgi:glycosyltransferase involved in cell wall biosynthesis
MKQLVVVIPTRNRLEKLKKALDSIPLLDYIYILVVCDGDRPTYEYLLKERSISNLKVVLVPQHKGAVYCRNSGIRGLEDGVLCATDDIVFEKHAIQHAFECFNKNFPDDDGVVGFVQDLKFHPTGVALVGKNFLKRYPNGQLFYPKYWHFACQEILSYCNLLGNRFVQDLSAKIIHFHPSILKGNFVDKTHEDARLFKKKDMALKDKRLKEGKVWPVS